MTFLSLALQSSILPPIIHITKIFFHHFNTMLLRIILFLTTLVSTVSFSPTPFTSKTKLIIMPLSSSSSPEYLVDPAARDEKYNNNNNNVGQYLVDLHDQNATFDFCGGMMFQLVLSDKLRQHYLLHQPQQPVVTDARRMHDLRNYEKSAHADNITIFHGREIRKVPHAAGGMGFVLQLSLANGNDPQGWTHGEVHDYNGWMHDVGRPWRTGKQLEKDGYADFTKEFGPDSFALHHRFYLHKDGQNRLWLAAEDGCEGTPSSGASNPFSNLFGMFR
jgi:hypothetical protein